MRWVVFGVGSKLRAILQLGPLPKVLNFRRCSATLVVLDLVKPLHWLARQTGRHLAGDLPRGDYSLRKSLSRAWSYRSEILPREIGRARAPQA
jgi:hypothetical protein